MILDSKKNDVVIHSIGIQS